MGLDRLGTKRDYTILTYRMLDSLCCNEQLLLAFRPLWAHHLQPQNIQISDTTWKLSLKPTGLLQAPTRRCVQIAHYSAVKHKIFPSKILLQCVCMKKWREGKERTSRVANTRRMRSATKDGSSAYPTTANCSIWSVFTGNLQIPCNNLYVSVMWNPSLHSFWSSLVPSTKQVSNQIILGFGLQIISPIWQSCFSVEADSDVLSFSSEVKVMYQAMPRT